MTIKETEEKCGKICEALGLSNLAFHDAYARHATGAVVRLRYQHQRDQHSNEDIKKDRGLFLETWTSFPDHRLAVSEDAEAIQAHLDLKELLFYPA